MEYNTQRGSLIIPEYGRNVQKMVEYAITIKDREERNRYAQGIVAIMSYLNPALKDIVDFRHKLWDHLFIISNFKLDVDCPYEKPTKNTLVAKPKRVSYPSGNIRFRHFGKITEDIVKEIGSVEDRPEDPGKDNPRRRERLRCRLSGMFELVEVDGQQRTPCLFLAANQLKDDRPKILHNSEKHAYRTRR